MVRETKDSSIEHLSVSQAKSCLARLAFERIAGIREPPSAAMNFGTYVHALAEAAYKRSEQAAPVPAGMSKNSQEAARKIFTRYWEVIGKRIPTTNLKVEHRFEFRDWTKRPIVGYIDLAYYIKDGVVVDIKTKGRSPEAIRSDEKLQLSTYRAALGLPIPGPAELHIISTEGDGEIYTLESDEKGVRGITAEDVERARERFVELDAAWELRRFKPEPSGLCQYCAAYQHCRGGKSFDGDIDKWIMSRAKVTPEATKKVEQVEQKGKAMEIDLQKSGEIRPYLKVALVGSYGTLKTRTALAFPSPVVVDTERGTDHYSKEFNFSRLKLEGESKEYFGKVTALLKKLGTDPGDFRTFEMDSWSVYCERVESAFSDIYLRREVTSAGNKNEYYVLQPRDYKPIHRELMKQINAMMRLNMHVVVTMQEKDKWAAGEELKVVGTTYDGYKRTPFFFDSVIYIKKVMDPKTGKERFVGNVDKDRTGCLPNRIDPFSIDALKGFWATYFDQKSAPTENVMEETIPAATPAPAATEAPAPAEKAPPAKTEEPTTTVEEPPAPPLKADYLRALLSLKDILKVPEEAWTAILAKRKVKSAERLTTKDLAALVAKLEEKLPASAKPGWFKLYPFRAPRA
jgi:CRISPR/Cas system-associated exonuclease Cas4 (RecB family)